MRASCAYLFARRPPLTTDTWRGHVLASRDGTYDTLDGGRGSFDSAFNRAVCTLVRRGYLVRMSRYVVKRCGTAPQRLDAADSVRGVRISDNAYDHDDNPDRDDPPDCGTWSRR